MADDNILEDVRAAAEALEKPASTETTGAPAAIEAPTLQQEQPLADSRARDEATGRFKAKETQTEQRPTLSLKEKPEAVVETQITKAPDKPEEKPTTEFPAPPVEWKGAAKVQWHRLPADIRNSILEDHAALKTARDEMAPLQQALAPHAEVLKRDAGSVESGIGQLMEFYRLYLTNPLGLVHHIARTRGLDLGQQQGQPPAPNAATDVHSLIAQAVQRELQPFKAEHSQRENQQIESTLAAFAADPKHPYFQDVKVDMGHLIQTGQAKTLEEAYERAIWANPVIRPQLLQEQAEEAARTREAALVKAKQAGAVSLRGAPLPNAQPNGKGGSNATALDSVRAAYAELHGG